MKKSLKKFFGIVVPLSLVGASLLVSENNLAQVSQGTILSSTDLKRMAYESAKVDPYSFIASVDLAIDESLITDEEKFELRIDIYIRAIRHEAYKSMLLRQRRDADWAAADGSTSPSDADAVLAQKWRERFFPTPTATLIP